MNFISWFLFFFVLEMHNLRQISASNIIRIPLMRTHSEMQKLSPHARIKVILDDEHFVNFGKISIGEPKQVFNVVFDTGSIDLWVFSSLYDTCDEFSKKVFNKRSLYNHVSSTTFKLLTGKSKQPKPQVISFASSWVFGFKAIDAITIAGNQVFAGFLEVTKATALIEHSRENGVMGLRYTPERGNIVSKICDQIKGEQKISFHLPKVKFNVNGANGEVVLCGEDESKYIAGTMNYFNETKAGTWNILIDSIKMEKKKKNVTIASKITALVDTGTNRINLPWQYFNTFFHEVKRFIIGSPELLEVDCSQVHSLPNVTFTIGETKHTMVGNDYIYEIEENCRIVIKKNPNDHWVLGEPFIRKYYTVFDMKNHKIGFAEKK